MANLSNINGKFLFTDGDFLKIGNLAPINNASSTESGVSITNSNVASIALTSTGANGKTFLTYTNPGGDYTIYDISASSPRLTINTGGDATFAGTISSSSISAEGMITVTQNDIGTGESVGLRIIRSGGAQIWNITSGLTGVDNTTFNIRNSTNNTNVFSIDNSTNAATFAGNVNVGGSVSSPASVGTILGVVGRNGVGAGTAGIVLKDYDNAGWDIWNSGGILNFRYNNGASGAGNGLSIDTTSNATFAGDVTTDGIYKITTAPDGNILELDQAGRSMDIGVYFSSNSTDSEWQFKTSTGNVNGATTNALVIKPSQATFAGDLHVGGASAARFKSDGTNTYIDAIPNPSSIIFRSSGSVEKMRIDANGVLQLTSGINGYLNSNSIGLEIDINRNPETGGFKDTGLSHARIIMRGDTTANGGSNIKFVTSPTVNTVGSTKMTIEGDGNVGIGTISPNQKLEVTGNIRIDSRSKAGSGEIDKLAFTKDRADAGTGTYEMGEIRSFTTNGYSGGMTFYCGRHTGGGGYALISTMTIGHTTEIGLAHVGIGTTTPSAKLTIISSGAQGLELGPDTSSSGNSGRIFWTNTAGGWAMMALGQVLSVRSAAQPGSTSGTSKVQLTNYSSTAWTASSDESLKENINSIGNVLDKINNYRCVEYNLIDDEDKNKKIGFIAQDWQKDFPQIVEEMEDEKIGMKYTETIPVLLKAIQELKAEIELLKNK